MKENEVNETRYERNYSTISPSAKTILLKRGHTQLPFASQVAALAMRPGTFEPDFQKKDFMFWARVLYFESRYKSIDMLLQNLEPTNMLELSSGFSFRGLDLALKHNIHFIDTDLPDVIREKQKMLVELESGLTALKGKLELLPLNVMDKNNFLKIINQFEPGPLLIINEGLLVYLNAQEKRNLCRTIHSVLKERGGYWITADIYLKHQPMPSEFERKDDLQSFLDRHNVDENMFNSFESAKVFFESEGFVIEKKAEIDYSRLDSLPYLLASAAPEILNKLGHAPKIQATWRLKAAG